MEVGLETLLQNFISSTDGAERSTETGKRLKKARRLPYNGTMAKKKDKRLHTPVNIFCLVKTKSTAGKTALTTRKQISNTK